MKTLCVDVRMLNSSGIGTYLQNLLPFFEGHFHLILLGNQEQIQKLSLKNVEIIPLAAPIYSISEQVKLPLSIPASDLFWSPHYNIPILPIRTKKRLTTIHDVFHLKYYDTLTTSQKIYSKLMLSTAVKRSEKIITVSNFSKSEIISYLKVDKKKINVIYNGVNPVFRKSISSDIKESIRKKYNLPQNYILFVGNVKPHKNLSTLINAFSLLKQDSNFSSYKLLIVGKRSGLITSSSDLPKLVDQLNIGSEITFLEEVSTSDLPLIYADAKATVQPSFYEGFGLPPLEAMASQCPVLVSDIPCFHEVYQDACLFFKPKEPSQIQQGIKKILMNESLRAELLEKGRKLVSNYNWETSAHQHIEAFEHTLKGD